MLHSIERGRRGAKGIFVRGQLDDILGGHAEFARDFLDWAAGLIDGEVFENGIDGEVHGLASKMVVALVFIAALASVGFCIILRRWEIRERYVNFAVAGIGMSIERR